MGEVVEGADGIISEAEDESGASCMIICALIGRYSTIKTGRIRVVRVRVGKVCFLARKDLITFRAAKANGLYHSKHPSTPSYPLLIQVKAVSMASRRAGLRLTQGLRVRNAFNQLASRRNFATPINTTTNTETTTLSNGLTVLFDR